MEKRAQAGEQLTPETVQRLRTPVHDTLQPSQQNQQHSVNYGGYGPPQQYQPHFKDYEEVSEVSEEESEDEGMMARFMRGRLMTMVRGETFPLTSGRGASYSRENSLDGYYPQQYVVTTLSPPMTGTFGERPLSSPIMSPLAMMSTFESNAPPSQPVVFLRA